MRFAWRKTTFRSAEFNHQNALFDFQNIPQFLTQPLEIPILYLADKFYVSVDHSNRDPEGMSTRIGEPVLVSSRPSSKASRSQRPMSIY